MPFNINEFKSNGLILGGARPSQFQVDLTLPFSSEEARRVQFFIQAAQIPNSSIDPINVFYFGRPIKFAGERTFMDWQVSVINDEDFPVRAILEKWQNDINTLISNKMSPDAHATNYKTNATVKQFDKKGEIVRSYIFQGLFPTQVDPIALSWAAGNEIEMFNVTFTYDYWEPEVQLSTDTYSPLTADDGNINVSRTTR